MPWKFMHIARAAVICAGLALASLANAAVTLNVTGGKLTGASGVDVGGTLYSVQFVDGTCFALFAPCDGGAIFTFTTQDAALAASQALLDQVFTGVYDDDASLTFGCTGASCQVVTPFIASGTGALSNMLVAEAMNNSLAVADSVFVGNLAGSYDTSAQFLGDALVFAAWTTQASTVPEPGTAGLGAAGLLSALFIARRRRQRSR